MRSHLHGWIIGALLWAIGLPASLGVGLHVLSPSPIDAAYRSGQEKSRPSSAHFHECCHCQASATDQPQWNAEHDCRICDFLMLAKRAELPVVRLVGSEPIVARPCLAKVQRVTVDRVAVAARGPPC